MKINSGYDDQSCVVKDQKIIMYKLKDKLSIKIMKLLGAKRRFFDNFRVQEYWDSYLYCVSVIVINFFDDSKFFIFVCLLRFPVTLSDTYWIESFLLHANICKVVPFVVADEGPTAGSINACKLFEYYALQIRRPTLGWPAAGHVGAGERLRILI